MSLSQHLPSVNSAIAEAWSTLFTKTVEIATNEPEDFNEFNVGDLSGNWVSAKISFSGDMGGNIIYYIQQQQALTMVGMMMSMGTDDALIESTREGDLGDEELDALNEAFNQLAATSATILRDSLDISLSASLEGVSKVELDGSIEGISEDDFIYGHSMELEGFEKEIFYQIAPKSLFVAESNNTSSSADSGEVDLNAIKGLSVQANVILAERNMPLSELMKLSQNSIIEFWKPCDNPSELTINDTVLANGEIVTADSNFGIRLLEIAPARQGTFQKGS